MMDLLDGDGRANQLFKLAKRILVHLAGIGDKNMTGTDGFAAEALGDILLIHGLDAAAEFFIYTKLAAAHFQAGLEMQQICPKRRYAGTASALPHKLQRIQHKAGVHFIGERGNVRRNLRGRHPAVAALSRLDHKQTDAGGEHAGIDGIYAAKLLCGDAGRGIRAGQLRTDVKMDDFIAFLQIGTEEIQKSLNRRGRGLRQRTVGAVAAIHVGRGKVQPVVIALLSEQNHKGEDFDVITLDQLRREITGAVGGDDDRFAHDRFLFCRVFARFGYYITAFHKEQGRSTLHSKTRKPTAPCTFFKLIP